MPSATKEGADPNVVPNSALRKRGTPGSSSPSKRLAKRRMSMRNRRVSFAPDPELTMVHTFEKDDYSGPSPPAFPVIAEAAEPAPVPPAAPAHPPPSPTLVDMEITQPLSAVQEGDEEAEARLDAAWNAMLAAGPPGDITAAVPSLAALAEEDELADLAPETNGAPQMGLDLQYDHDNVTAAVPSLGALLEEDEAAEAADDGADADMDLTVPISGALNVTVPAPSPAAAPLPSPGGEQITAAAGFEVPPTQAQEEPAVEEEQEDKENEEAPRPSPSLAASEGDGLRAEGQASKWGFVPGDDDTMELDLEGHGRAIMGDRTYAGLYGDGVTRTGAVLASEDPQDALPDDGDSLHARGGCVEVEEEPPVAAAAVAEPAPAGEGPDWRAPAFLPPFMAAPAADAPGPDSDHPALHQSPAFTNSSLNTMSTRRVSVDARRASVTSRRASMAPGVIFAPVEEAVEGVDGDTGALLAGRSEGGAPAAPADGGAASDVTDDLLADDDDGMAAGGATSNLLAGLQHQVRMLSKGSPAPNALAAIAPSPAAAAAAPEQQQQHTAHTDNLLADGTSPLGPSASAGSLGGAGERVGGAAAAKTPFSVGYADSSYNPATAGLLRTGGTTGLLLADATGGAEGGAADGPADAVPGGNHTRGTQGTTRLLRMDVTAASAIAAGAKVLLGGGAAMDEDVTAPLLSPTSNPHHKMSNSPPASALSLGSMGRAGAGPHSVRSFRSGGPPPVPAAHFTPGGTRLARTPGSVMAPSAGGHGPFAAPPGSAIAARYPGSAVAQGRLSQGFTPSLAPPITFQDFAKIVEVQFLDNLRRGSSINYADLAPNPIPAGLSDAYALLCVTSPNLAELETAVHTLRSETSRLRSSASDLELMLGGANPPIFRHVQTATAEQLEAFRANVGLLKKVCRAKAVVLLKDVRCQMEESKSGRLARAAEGIKADLTYVEEQAKHTRGVAAAAEKFAAETREGLVAQAEARAMESERRRRVAAARAALEEARRANAERKRRLEETAARAEELRRERQALAVERASVAAAAEDARAALAKLSAAVAAAGGGADPRAVLAQLQAVARLESCLGVKVEQAAAGTTSALALRVGDAFRLRVEATPAGVRGTVEVVADGNSSGLHAARRGPTSGAAQRSLAAALAGVSPSGGEAFFVDPSGAAAAVQTAVARLQRCTDLAGELRGVRAACRHLTQVAAAPGGAGLRLLFSGLHADVRFAVTLVPGPAYPLAALPVSTEVYYDGDGQVEAGEVASAVARAPAGPGRIRAACAELSRLVEAMAPRGAKGAYRSAFGNPLFGSSGAAEAPAAVQPVA